MTFQWSYNCGSILQCVALKGILERWGHEVEVINYSSPEQRRLYSVFFKCSNMKNVIKNILCLRGKSMISAHCDQYKKYIVEQFSYTNPPYSTLVELEENLPQYDALIAGGDQIWNVNCDDFTIAYMLSFDENTYKFSYSPSLGATDMCLSSKAAEYADLLKRFDGLSCREPNGQKRLEVLLQRDVELALDPTLLTVAADWPSPSPATVDDVLAKGYIFYYAFTYSRENNIAVQRLAEQLDLAVVVIDAKQWYIRGLDRYDNFVLSKQTGPDAFLKYMANSLFVVTTSFHGTAFSVVFKKKFVYINSSNHNPADDRTSALIERLGLESRFVTTSSVSASLLTEEIDYDLVEDKLDEMRGRSLEYLKKNLENAENDRRLS